MTRDEIIRIGLESGMPAFQYPELISEKAWGDIERFASLVAAAEREACAKVCEAELGNTMMLASNPPQSSAAWNAMNAIRARSKT